MKYVWLIILICLISVISGCASPMSNSQFEDSLISEKIFIQFNFVDSPTELEGVCGELTVGCALCNDAYSYCQVYSVKERCVLDHEIDHVLFGDFHKGIPSTCAVRAK